jgi:hypothetical protein
MAKFLSNDLPKPYLTDSDGVCRVSDKEAEFYCPVTTWVIKRQGSAAHRAARVGLEKRPALRHLPYLMVWFFVLG